ncbi:hypothetical protein [Nocardiopsis potens]|uniref:hypothetical protein n=1 Tax=Nocardiopsis potens TaxID=1246458 RepID=UPI0003476D6A|nr:hypothetical protein [Nocardiopsis potens]
MPIIEATHAPEVAESKLREPASVLPHLVSVAVECPEEPYDGDVKPGDLEVRFRARGPLDRSGLDAVIEVKSEWFESRAADRQERVDGPRREIRAATGLRGFGVYPALPVSAWSQGD